MPVVPSDAQMIRQRLAGLRVQRQENRAVAEHLAERTRQAVRDAQAAGVTVAEIARLLDMDRSSVYRTYVQAAA